MPFFFNKLDWRNQFCGAIGYAHLLYYDSANQLIQLNEIIEK